MRGVASEQERVGRPFLSDGGRNGRACERPFLLDMTKPIRNFLVCGEGMRRKAEVPELKEKPIEPYQPPGNETPMPKVAVNFEP